MTTDNMVDAVRNTVMLALVSAVYYWRARTEEKHLLTDPAYVAYANWMEAYAPIPRFVRWVTGKGPSVAVPAE